MDLFKVIMQGWNFNILQCKLVAARHLQAVDKRMSAYWMILTSRAVKSGLMAFQWAGSGSRQDIHLQ